MVKTSFWWWYKNILSTERDWENATELTLEYNREVCFKECRTPTLNKDNPLCATSDINFLSTFTHSALLLLNCSQLRFCWIVHSIKLLTGFWQSLSQLAVNMVHHGRYWLEPHRADKIFNIHHLLAIFKENSSARRASSDRSRILR